MRNNDRRPQAGRHSAGSRSGPPAGERRDAGRPARARKEPLRDNYYYEEPYGQPGARQEFQDISSYSSERERRAGQRRAERPPKPPRRRGSAGRVIGWVLTLMLVALVGAGVYVLSALRVKPLEGGLSADLSVRTAGVKNIALFGVDARERENEGRSDVMMVLTADSRSHKLKLASLMRDSEVYIEGYGYDKLTHAYAYGGPSLAVRTINENFDLDIEDYVTVNFYEMAEIVDAFGGVELELSGEEMLEVNRNLWNLSREVEEEGGDSGIRHDDYFTATDGTHNMVDGEYVGGKVKLNGRQAVAFARIRELGGDGERTSRQHQVLVGLLDQVRPGNFLRLPSMARGLLSHSETSLDLSGLAGLAPFALGGFQVESATFPGEAEGAYGDTNEEDSWVLRFDQDLMVQNLHGFIFG